MLLAVEGGGFFSASASGYSKGLTLLFLGQKNSEDKPMRVTPWNQYQLVDIETDSDLQLASRKSRFVRLCTSLDCFGCATPGPESPSPLKVGPAQQQGAVPQPLVPYDDCGDEIHSSADDAENTKSNPNVILRSSLKKPPKSIRLCSDSNERHAVYGKDSKVASHNGRRQVQWTDNYGGELVDIREFEPSEDSDSDDGFDGGNEKVCSCKIM